LPFFIPGWLGFIGAESYWKLLERDSDERSCNSRKKFFDNRLLQSIGGFCCALAVACLLDFLTLPEADYIYSVHP